MAIRQSFSEAMETDSKLSGPDEVVSGSGLLDGTNVEEKKLPADECRQSEALSFSRGLTAAVSCYDFMIDIRSEQSIFCFRSPMDVVIKLTQIVAVFFLIGFEVTKS